MARLLIKRHSLRLLAVLLLAACSSGGGGGATAPGLSRIEITPVQPTLAKGSFLNLTATGIYSDNSTRSLNSEVTWQSSDEGIAVVSETGELSAANPGLTTVQASLNGISGNTTITVTNATLSRLEFSPTSVQLAKGTRRSLALTGHYSDGSTQDVTEQATLSVDNTSVASLTSPVISGDLWLTGLTAGSTVLNAILGTSNTQLNVTITAASLIKLIINPETSAIALGTSLELTALGLYSDGSSQPLTEQVDWISDDTGILTVSSSGQIQSKSVGTSTVTASLSDIPASHTATVTDAVLTAIEINTSSDVIPTGNQQTLTALGHYSDGSLQDLTEQVIWQGTPNTRIAISNAAGSRGLSTALSEGLVTVTTTLGDITGSLELTISAATLDSIEISPLNARLASGTLTSFIATGRYSDGSIQDVSEQASWTTANPAIAVANNVTDSRGQTLALDPGNTTVSATLDGITGNASLAVTAAQLLGINVVPQTLDIPAGTYQTVSAEGRFSDGSVQNLDSTVTWESDSPAIAVVNSGNISALQPGSARIIASQAGISGNTSVTVNNATLVSLKINPVDTGNTLTLAVGTETQLQAVALYSDGSEEDVTTQVTWSSADIARLRVDNYTGQQGRLVALEGGNVGGTINITASLNNVQISVAVTISDASLTGLRITAGSASLDSAEQQQLMVTGDFSDGSTQDLTSFAVWSSDVPGLAHVSNKDSSHGTVTAEIDVGGPAIITASYGGFSSTYNLTINNTPTRPVSMVVLATPNVINNNDIDASSLEIRVRAASPNASVADGTVINLQISQGGIIVGSQSLVTTNGIASTTLTTSSTETGLLLIEASIAGTTVSNSTALYTSSTIYDVIAGAAFASIQNSADKTQILTGSRFGIFMLNLSNRTFPLLKYEITNGTDILASTTTAQDLNNNLLTGGLKIGAIYTHDGPDFIDKGVEARFYLTDPSTGASFYYSVKFTTP